MILLFSLAILALTAALTPLFTRFLGRNTGWIIALVDLALAAWLTTLAPQAMGNQPPTYNLMWIPDWNIALRLRMDGLSWFFAMLALVIGAIVMVYSTRYFAPTRDGQRLTHTSFFLLMASFTFSMVLLVFADDLIVLFVGWELTSLMSFMLIGRSGHAGEAGALRTLFLTFVGGLFFMAAVVTMAAVTGTTHLTAALASPVWSNNPTVTAIVAVLVAIGGFTKAAQFPFHLWLPEAMAAETPVSAYLHAAAVVKAGIFVLLRFSVIFRTSLTWQILLVTVGMFTALMAGLFALQKTDLKKLLAYSTVSQLGWIIATIGIGTPAALTAAVLHTLAHALFKSGLFMMVGCVQHTTGTRDIRRLPELWKHTPVLFGVVLLGSLGMAGIPPTLGFVSKEGMLGSFLTAWGGGAGAYLLTGCGVVGAALTIAYSSRIVFGGFIDGTREVVEKQTSSPVDAQDIRLHPLPSTMLISGALPAVLGVPLYFMLGLLERPLSAISAPTYTLATTPDGSHTPPNGHAITLHLHMIEPSIVLVLSLIAILGGITLVVNRHQIDQFLARPLLPRTGAENLTSLWKGMRAVGNWIDSLTRSDSPTRHAGALIITLTMLAGGVLVSYLKGNITFAPKVSNLDKPIDAVVLLIVIIGCLGAVTTTSRMAAIVLLGAVGIGITLQIFALGAPDVGLTQLLVEILTTVMYMLVLRRLPRTFHRAGRRRQWYALIIAVLAGLAAFGGAYALTGRRDRSQLAQYYLDHAPELTTGSNVTNTIINEFRAFDTYGEMAVLGITGLAIAAVLLSITPEHRRTGSTSFHLIRQELRERVENDGRIVLPTSFAYRDTITNSYPLRVFVRFLSPILLTTAVVIFWRGHQAPGGGFIAGLIVAVFMVLAWLAMPVDRPLTRRAFPIAVVTVGLTLATATGVAGYFSTHNHSRGVGISPHAFLSAIHWKIPLLGHVSSAVFFDLGILLCVIGMVLTALNQFGSSQSPFGSDEPENWPPYDPLHTDPREEGPLPNPYVVSEYHPQIVHREAAAQLQSTASTPLKANTPRGDQE